MDDREKMKQAIADTFKKDASEIQKELRLKEDLLAKSGHYFSIIAALEEITGKKVTYAQLRRCKTVGEIYAFEEILKA